MHRALCLILTWVPLLASSGSTLPDEIHLIQPYPRGKADSVLASGQRLVFIPENELSALEEAAKTAVFSLPAPPVPGTVSSVNLEGSVHGDIARLTASIVVDVLEEGAVYVPLVARTTPVLSIRASGTPLALTAGGPVSIRRDAEQVSTGAWWGVVMDGPGRRVLTMTLPVPVIRTDDGGSFQITLPPVGRAALTVALPPGEWDVESSPGSAAFYPVSRGAGVGLDAGSGGTISLSWRHAARRAVRPRETREVTLDAASEHLASVGEATVRGQVQFDLRVWTGQVQVLDIAASDGVEVMNVTSPNLDTWERHEGGIRVYLASPVQGDERLSVEYLQTLPGPEGSVSVPSLAVKGARRQMAHWAVVATTNIEVELAEQHGVEVLQPRELPESLRSAAAGRILVALRGDPSHAKSVIRISRHADVPVLVASIDRAQFSTVVYRSGSQVTTCRYDVRNTTKQFLELTLPTGAQLWDVRVDASPVRPGLVNGTVLVPLASSLGRSEETTFPVELTYLVPMRLSPLAGRLTILGPRPDVPASRVAWEVRYPKRLNPLHWGGNMERDETPLPHSRPVGAVLRDDGSLGVPAGAYEKAQDEAGIDDAPSSQDLHVRGGRQEQKKVFSPEQQDMKEIWREYSQQLTYGKKARRSVGMPSVEVKAPSVGTQIRFAQILQQSETPEVNLIYIRSGIRWEWIGVGACVLIIVGVSMRWRRRHVIAAVALMALQAGAVEAPREITRMVPNDELAQMLTGRSSQALAYVPYSRISDLLVKLRSSRSPFAMPAVSILDKVELTAEVRGDEARIVGSASLLSIGRAWRAVDLVSPGARVGRVTLGSAPASLWSTDGRTKVLVEGEGIQQLEFEYFAPVTVQGNGRVLTCPVPPSMGCLLTVNLPPGSSGLTVDGRRVELETGAAVATAVVPVLGQNAVALTWRYVPPELMLPAGARPGEAGPVRGKLLVETLTLFSVDAQGVEGQTKCSADIVQGSRDSLVFGLPPGLEILDVASSAVEDWAVMTGDDRRLVALLRNGSKGRVTVNITHAVSFPETITAMIVQEPAIRDVVRYRGQAGLQVLTSVRVTPVSQMGSTRTDPRDLPADLWTLASNPILLAYKHIDPSYVIELRVDQQTDIPLLTASVDREHLLSVISSSGRIVNRARLRVRNSGEQFLKVTLPEDARVWSYGVNGATAAPSRGDDGTLRLPVPPSADGQEGLTPIEIELVWGHDVRLAPCGGRVDLAGPRLDIPCSVVEWDVYVPRNRPWLRISSNLDTEPWFEPWLHRDIAFDEGRMMAQVNIADYAEQGPSDGWAAGAMPVKVDIPLEGYKLAYSRPMLIGQGPAVALLAAPIVPRGLVSAIALLAILLLWRFSKGMRIKGFAVRIILTAVAALAAHRLVVASALAGLLWRAVVERRSARTQREGGV